jgi:hypothetical protein
MAIVEARITSSCQLQDASTRAFGQTTWAGPAAADVCQSGGAARSYASAYQASQSTLAARQRSRSGTRQVSLNAR